MFGYFELNHSGSRFLEQDVEWGDFVFPTGAKVTADCNSSFSYTAWRHALLELPEVRISGSAGTNYLTLGTGLKADGTVVVPMASGAVDGRVSVSAPVLQIDLQLDWALTRRLAVKMYIMYIRQINIADINGGLDKESIDLKEHTSGDTRARFRYQVRGFSFYHNPAS